MSLDRPERSAQPLPSRPAPEATRPSGSLWSVVIAGATGLAIFIGLFFLAGALGPVVLGVGLALGGIYVIGCLHYLLWGRWLGDAIRQEVEEEEADKKLEDRKSKFE